MGAFPKRPGREDEGHAVADAMVHHLGEIRHALVERITLAIPLQNEGAGLSIHA
jgi:hypothetical protein